MQTKAKQLIASLIYLGRLIEAAYNGPTDRDRLGFKGPNSSLMDLGGGISPYEIQDIYEQKAREIATQFLNEPDTYVVSYEDGFIKHNGVKYCYALRIREEYYPIKKSLYTVIKETFPTSIKRQLFRSKREDGSYANTSHYWIEKE